MATTTVTGVRELQKVLDQLPDVLQRKYLKQLVTWGSGQVRNRARQLAPKGGSDSTDLKSQSARARHIKLKKGIKTLKTKTIRQTGVVHGRVIGPPQQGPLLSGHRKVLWGKQTSDQVAPVNPYMKDARDQMEGSFEAAAVQRVKTLITRDAARMGKQSQAGKLSAKGQAKLAAIRGVRF